MSALTKQLADTETSNTEAHASEVASVKLALERAKRDAEATEADLTAQIQAVRRTAEERVSDAEAQLTTVSKARRDLSAKLDEVRACAL